MVSMKIL